MPSPPPPDPLQQYAGLIHKVASGYGRDAHDRDELVQEIALQVWLARERYDPRFAATTWIYRIALNVAISWFRREQRYRRRRRPIDDDAVLAAPLPEPDERVAALLRAIDSLGAIDRALVLLHLDDLDHKAIGEVLGISPSNVGTRLARLRQRLRQRLTEHDDTPSVKDGNDGTR